MDWLKSKANKVGQLLGLGVDDPDFYPLGGGVVCVALKPGNWSLYGFVPRLLTSQL